MALKHWWQLNGDLKDRGYYPVDLINSTATLNDKETNGKIGRCYDFNGTTSKIEFVSADMNTLGGDKPFSICFWFNSNDTGSRSIYFGDYNEYSLSGSMNFNIEKTAGNYARFYWGGNPDWTISSGTPIDSGWHHIAFVYDTHELRYYFDGRLEDTKSGVLSSRTKTNTTWYLGGDSRTGSTCFNGSLNDFRIYDNAISDKEVIELAEACVVHYDFNDPEIEPTTNLITKFDTSFNSYADDTSLGTLTFSNQANATVYKITTVDGQKCANFVPVGSNLRCYFYQSTYASKTYTISVEYKSDAASNSALHLERNGGDYSWTGLDTAYTSSDVNKWKKLSITFTNTTDTTLYCFIMGPANANIYFRHFQLEEKDHATFFTSGSRTNALVYNATGYNYNAAFEFSATDPEDPSILPNAPIGKTFVNIPLGAFLRCNSHVFDRTEFTYSAWIRHHGRNGTSTTYAFTNGRADGTHWGWGVGINDNGYHIHYGDSSYALTVPQNEWHFLLVSHKQNKNYNIYLDGQLVTTKTATTLPTYEESVGLGFGSFCYSNNPKLYPSNCDIADFKFYTTALGDTDAEYAYNHRASIDHYGNLHIGTVDENNNYSRNKIAETSTLYTQNISEYMEWEDGSAWILICKHCVPDGLFTTTTGSDKAYIYNNPERWYNFGLTMTAERPEDNYYEFLVMHQTEVNSPFRWYRFKQTLVPNQASWDDVNPSKVGTNVIRIGSSQSSVTYGGLYIADGSNNMVCFANSNNGNWYGCGIKAAYNGGIPSYNGDTCKGYQLVYMRVKNPKMKLTESGVAHTHSVIEN